MKTENRLTFTGQLASKLAALAFPKFSTPAEPVAQEVQFISRLTGKPAAGGPGVGQKYKPQADIADPRGGDTWANDNIGSGQVTEVFDRQPTRPWTPNRDSMERSLKGRGLNDCSMLESSREYLNQGPQLEGDVDETGGFDGQDLRGIGGRGRD